MARLFRLAAMAALLCLYFGPGDRAMAAVALTKAQVLSEIIGQRLNFQSLNASPPFSGQLVYAQDGTAQARLAYMYPNRPLEQPERGRWTVGTDGLICTEWILKGGRSCFYMIYRGSYGRYRSDTVVEYWYAVD